MTYSAVQMKKARLELRITDELLEQIDAARGDVSRTRWVERALEKALSQSGAGTSMPPRVAPADDPVGRAAPSRVPGVVRASSLSKVGVKPRPKLK